jgi:gamma-glutamylcyclotransferase (GGCT)/AIG2-like uncharacterized protein YtfP
MSQAVGPLGVAQRRRLTREARSLGPARVTGRLYDLGEYPGLVLSSDPRDVVHGELFELGNPRPTLRWLDDYEGLRPGGATAGEYSRPQIPVMYEEGSIAGASVDAWAYVYMRRVSAALRVAKGRWNGPGRALSLGGHRFE